MWKKLLVLNLAIVTLSCRYDGIEVQTLNEGIMDARVQTDLMRIHSADSRLKTLLEESPTFIRLRALNAKAPTDITSEDKIFAREFWAQTVEALVQLDQVKRSWSEGEQERLQEYNPGVALSYYAWSVQLFHSIQLLGLVEPSDTLKNIWNDADNTFSIVYEKVFSDGSLLDLIRFRFYRSRMNHDYRRSICPSNLFCRYGYETTLKYGNAAWKKLKSVRGLITSFKMRGASRTGKLYSNLWFPAQKGVAEWMGDAKIVRRGQFLITSDLIAEMQKKLAPGDILFIRRNWFISNVGLPGFWPHAALYIGTPSELSQYMSESPDVDRYYLRKHGRTFMAQLAHRFPEKFAKYQELSDHEAEGHNPYRVIEALSEGVMLTSIEHAAHGDYVGALRPVFSRLDVAHAIETAFEDLGKEYDFDFSFLTDAKVVCTEVVDNAWEPGSNKKGFKFREVVMMGRPTLPANEMVKQWADSKTQARHELKGVLDFVYFIDSNESENRSFVADEKAFFKSHTRPKLSPFL